MQVHTRLQGLFLTIYKQKKMFLYKILFIYVLARVHARTRAHARAREHSHLGTRIDTYFVFVPYKKYVGVLIQMYDVLYFTVFW